MFLLHIWGGLPPRQYLPLVSTKVFAPSSVLKLKFCPNSLRMTPESQKPQNK